MINKILFWLFSSPAFWVFALLITFAIVRYLIVKVFSILSYYNEVTEENQPE